MTIDSAPISERHDGDADGADGRLRRAIDDLANQLCVAVDGNFDFAVRSAVEDEALEKLSMLVNFVLDTARRGMTALRAHNEALAELDRAKTVFFSNASHELRTPLTLILGPLEEALSRPGAADPEALATAHRNAVRLLKLVNALLDFTRIEAGRVKASFAPTDLGALTTELAGVFRDAIERAGLSLTVDCPAGGEPVYVDRQMWEHVVLNLLSNAFKFTFEGGITVTLGQRDGRAELEVRDTGIGIAPEQLPRIFERFHRVEGARSRTHEGFGIGLAMIHELVRMHGGAVTVSSTPGRGTSFVVSVPMGSAHLPAEAVVEQPSSPQRSLVDAFLTEVASWTDAGRRADARAPAAPDAEAARDSARVLVADDNADMRAYIGRLLAPHWHVETVADGEEALAAVRRERPDLVLCDVMMPNLDGHQILRVLRANPDTASIPIVLLSARAGEEAVVEAFEGGADDYLIKPFSPRELVARVRTHIELSRLRNDAAVIQRIGALLNAQLDLETVVQTLTSEATKVSGAAFGAMFYNVVDAQGERYMLYTLAGAPREAFAKFPTPRNTDLFAPTFRGEAIVRIDDVLQDPRYGTNAPYHGMPPGHLPVRSYLAVPVVARSGEVLGGLFFGHPRPGVFTARSERLLRAIATQAAIAIENAHLYQREQAARAQAESANRAKDEFLAMLGHELRNPLAPIVTALQILELRGQRTLEPTRSVIERQVKHLVRLVDDLLDVSRITRGKIELKRELVELAHVIGKAVEIASPVLEQRRHQLEVSVPTSGLLVHADPVRLGQVVSNLLTNAAKYTEPGGRITVAAARVDSEIVIRVRDTGIGISAELLPRIFDLFMQAPQSLARSEGGLGLGLTIVRSLTLLHGGTVEAHSDGPGTGSEFVVKLPATPAAAVAAESVAADARPARSAGSRRVLIVDDNQDAAEMLAHVLALAGHTIEVAHDGLAAVTVAARFRPQIALLDIGLPVIDGYQVAERLRAIPDLDGVRLVAVSGYGQDADRERSLAAGFDAHLVKPVDIDTLLPLIERLAAA